LCQTVKQCLDNCIWYQLEITNVFFSKEFEQPDMILNVGITEVANCDKFASINCQSRASQKLHV